jgi:Ser/Thr protein kinase RdoA (MazF antagonist)
VRLLGRGRDCDILDLGDGRVLRRRRRGGSLEAEARVMRHVAAHGYPCPEVHDVDGPDIVLDRLDGPTLERVLLDDPSPGNAQDAGLLLAQLHERLHRLPPLTDQGPTVVHLDLHPQNVIITASGPVVIDWTNARDGPAELDLAMTWVLVEPYRATVPGAAPLLDA